MSRLFAFKQLGEALGVEPIGDSCIDIEKVAIDSREADDRSLFVPLRGEVTDGNLFIEGALKNGCRCSLVSKEYFSENEDKITSFINKYGCSFFVVEDGLSSLHDLARSYIKRFPDLIIVGITGSSGKTSTKEVLGAILRCHDNTLVTKGNYNSETGLPLTVFRINSTHNYAVIEMGMNNPGEIKALVDIVNPYSSIITNIGRAHIGNLGSVDAIAKEKKDAFANFTGNNLAVIPSWDNYHDFLSDGVKGQVLSVSDSPDYISEVKNLGFNGWEFFYEGLKVSYPYIGQYNLLNAFLAIACARELGIPGETIAEGLGKVKHIFGRGEILSGRNRVIRDCYNANPDSTISSLDLLSDTTWDGDKVAILGDMLELGESSFKEHLRVLEYCLSLNFTTLILLGEEYEAVYQSLEDRTGILSCKDFKALEDTVKDSIKDNSLVLLKGSRGMKLEDITSHLL